MGHVRNTRGFLCTRRTIGWPTQPLDGRPGQFVGVAALLSGRGGLNRWGGSRRGDDGRDRRQRRLRGGRLHSGRRRRRGSRLGDGFFARPWLMPPCFHRNARRLGGLVGNGFVDGFFGGRFLDHGLLGDTLGLHPRFGNVGNVGGGLGRFGGGLGGGLLGFRLGGRHRGGDGRGSGLVDVMINDVGADDGRGHRRQYVHCKFRQVFQHAGHSPVGFDAKTLRRIEGSTATDRWQFGKRRGYGFNSTSRNTISAAVSLSTSCSTPALRK